MALAMRATHCRLASCPRQRTPVLAPPVRLATRIGAVTSRRGAPSEPMRRLDRVDTAEQLHSRAYNPQRQEKLEKYLSGWKNDVESTGPLWNPFTVIMATAAFVVFGLGLFAWLSHGILWGVQGGSYY